MINEDKILLRRQILDWRDKHIENIDHHLNREIIFLFNELEQKIQKMSIRDIFKSDAYTKRLQPIYTRWLKNELPILINAAQFDLNKIHQHTFEYLNDSNKLDYKNDNETLVDATKVVLSTGAAIYALPSFLSLLTTTVAAEGVLGILGATTTIINWPIALAGIAVIGGLAALGGNKATKLKVDAINRYKKTIRKNLYGRIIYNKANDSVCQSLQMKIEEISSNLLRELSI